MDMVDECKKVYGLGHLYLANHWESRNTGIYDCDFIIYVINNFALRFVSEFGHLHVIKYLVECNKNIRVCVDLALQWASKNVHMEVVKYLVSCNTDIHTYNDNALQLVSEYGHLNVVNYLVSCNTDIPVRAKPNFGCQTKVLDLHAKNVFALQWAPQQGHLHVVEYLVSCNANIYAGNDFALQCTSYHDYVQTIIVSDEQIAARL